MWGEVSCGFTKPRGKVGPLASLRSWPRDAEPFPFTSVHPDCPVSPICGCCPLSCHLPPLSSLLLSSLQLPNSCRE